MTVATDDLPNAPAHTRLAVRTHPVNADTTLPLALKSNGGPAVWLEAER